MNERGYKLILKYLKPHRQNLRSVIIFALVSNVFLLIVPFAIKQLIEQYSILIYQEATIFLISLILLFLVGISIMQLLQMNLIERLQRRIFLNGFERVVGTAERTNEPIGLKKLNYIFETVNLQKSLAPLITDGLTLAIQAAFVFILISIYHPSFLVFSILMIAALYYTIVVLGRRGEDLTIIESERKYEAIAALDHLAMKTEGSAASETNVKRTLSNYFQDRENRYRLYFRQSYLLLIIKVIAAMMLLSLGGVLVVTNTMSIGQLVASELIVINLLISLFKVSNILEYWYASVVGVKKLQDHFPEFQESR